MKNEKVRVMSEDWPVKCEALPHQSEDWTLSFEWLDLHLMSFFTTWTTIDRKSSRVGI